MKYTVIARSALHEVEAEVQLLLDDGWHLQGGICMGVDSYSIRMWSQAMVYANEEPHEIDN